LYSPRKNKFGKAIIPKIKNILSRENFIYSNNKLELINIETQLLTNQFLEEKVSSVSDSSSMYNEG